MNGTFISGGLELQRYLARPVGLKERLPGLVLCHGFPVGPLDARQSGGTFPELIDRIESLFAAEGEQYQEPVLVLFTGAVESACGFAQAAVGPFYCPTDHKLYIDLSFYQDLRNRLGAPGDFAQAYVIAHEVGHHVQTLAGISQRVAAARQGASQAEGNELSVRQELQADCFAGIWAHHAQRSRQILEQGDIEEALNAAAAIGDDRLQRQSGGFVAPETFTHGTSAQRVRWFRTGLESGDVDACDTFGAGRV